MTEETNALSQSPQTAPPEIVTLVDRFDRQRADYRSGKYNETQLRRDFLDPLFEALGWDMTNRKGYSERFREVVHESSVEVEGGARAADYAFQSGGSILFFLEAKKPAVNIGANPEPAFQIRRYAWSAKLPVSILSDFEQMAVYDCRLKPIHGDPPHLGRVKLYSYKDYVSKWDELYRLFSYQAVHQGSLDQFSEGLKGKRGTADVDDDFLVEMERWREELARNIALRNPALNGRQINYAVQTTIDRLIFLRICEDRGIEPENALREATDGKDVYGDLLELFYKADRKYNSGLFHFHEEKGQSTQPDAFTPNLKIDDRVFKDILANLYYPKSPYAFKYISADILGQVYERFLGKVIRLTAGHQARVEEKPEVRKAGGVYYTPTYIVDYIVKNTVGELLKDQTPETLKNRPLRVLDPACGSGSFLLGAYQFLLDWHLDWYTHNDPARWARGKNPPVQETRSGWQLTMDKKKDILTAHIFGVDIDPQAVEVTKLSLLLKVVENPGQLSLLGERILPDLGRNIQCGNSLIGPDYYDGVQPGLFDDEEHYRVNAFDWQRAFPEPFREGGFDAVIGNPPYVLISNQTFEPNQVKYLINYLVAEYKIDLFHLFIQKGVEILRSGGKLGFITPNTWFTLQFTNKLREFVLRNTRIDEIVQFDHKVFENVNVHTGLIFLKKNKDDRVHKVKIKIFSSDFEPDDLNKNECFYIPQDSWMEQRGYKFEIRQSGDNGSLIKKIIKNYNSLDTIARASLGCQAYNSSKHTKEQIKNRVFHSPTKLSDDYLPELAGNDVGRYFIQHKKGQWIKYGPWLHDFRTIDWLTGPRILIREIPGKIPYRICASFVIDTYCNYKTILNVNPSKETKISMQYLLGIINSRLISFLFPLVSDKLYADTFPRLSVKDIRKLPIRSIDFSDSADVARHDRMVALVESMLEMHKRLPAAATPDEKERLQRQIDQTDRQIDKLVYELYDLTEEEIRIVETSSMTSEV